MTEVFIDTSFLLALALKSDELHHRARAWKEFIRNPLVTTDFILVEVANSLALPEDRPSAESIFDELYKSGAVQIVPASRELIHRGYSLFTQRRDKSWGLTDCISFEIMRERGIGDALTYDHHFQQAGFTALLRADPPSN